MSKILKFIWEAVAKFWHHWQILLADKTYRLSLTVGLFALVFAYYTDYLATVFNDTRTYSSVGDLILDNIAVYDMEFFFTWVMYGLIVLIFVYAICVRPEIAPFAMKTFAILIFMRAGFIIMTNIGPPEDFFYTGKLVGGDIIANWIFKNDLFFSGHTAYPYLGFLLFREARFFRWLLFLGSVLMGITVLAMHVHYSIDVFAAYFIVYGAYAISKRFFEPLNVRFSERIKLHGWAAKLTRLRQKSKLEYVGKK